MLICIIIIENMVVYKGNHLSGGGPGGLRGPFRAGLGREFWGPPWAGLGWAAGKERRMGRAELGLRFG